MNNGVKLKGLQTVAMEIGELPEKSGLSACGKPGFTQSLLKLTKGKSQLDISTGVEELKSYLKKEYR